MLIYPASIDLSNSTLCRVTRLVARHRRRSAAAGAVLLRAVKRCWCWRTCTAVIPTRSWPQDPGSASPRVYRYVRETVDLLADLAPTLADAVETARAKAYVILDGTLLAIDRIAADRPYYSGKHKRHGREPRPDRAFALPLEPAPTTPVHQRVHHHHARGGRDRGSSRTRLDTDGRAGRQARSGRAGRRTDRPVAPHWLAGQPALHRPPGQAQQAPREEAHRLRKGDGLAVSADRHEHRRPRTRRARLAPRVLPRRPAPLARRGRGPRAHREGHRHPQPALPQLRTQHRLAAGRDIACDLLAYLQLLGLGDTSPSSPRPSRTRYGRCSCTSPPGSPATHAPAC